MEAYRANTFNMKYKVSFVIYPNENKIPLGISNFSMILRRKLRIIEEMCGEIRRLRIVKELTKNTKKEVEG